MAITAGGWKCSSVVIQYTDVQQYDESAELVSWFLKQIADCFVANGLWEYDSTIHSGNNNPIQLNTTNHQWNHGCFFVNKTSGAKAFLGYCFSGSPNQTRYDYLFIDNGYVYPHGLLFTMIPPNQGSFNTSATFGSKAFLGGGNSTFPVAGCGFVTTNSVDSNVKKAQTASFDYENSLLALYKSSQDGWVKYSFVQKDDCCFIVINSSYVNSQTRNNCFMFGKLLDESTLARPDVDTELPETLYGVGMVYTVGYGSSRELYEIGTVNKTGIQYNGLFWDKTSRGPSGFMLRKANINGNTYTDTQLFSDVQGPFLGNVNSWMCLPSTFINYQFRSNDNVYTIGPKANDGWARLHPVAISYGLYDANDSNKFIFSDTKDNFKGYIRPDALLFTRNDFYQVNQTFGDGKYIHIGDGICIGWDKTNGQGF